MNYIIWKNIDSRNIDGLLISELPPITKPKMRIQETKIDGVDGSIIEELGYETYDKTIRIGLTRNFDIDEIIKYFSGDGDIVFSNEPNKFYKARIINQINYEKLLSFKEATIKFRVQPFKYEYNEEQQAVPTGIIEGENIQLNVKKVTQLLVQGNSIQKTRSGKNLFNKNDNSKIFNAYLSYDTKTVALYENNRTIYIPVIANKTYSIKKFIGSSKITIATSSTEPSIGSSIENYFAYDTLEATYTIPENQNYLLVFVVGSADLNTGYTYDEILDNVQIEENTIFTEYEPYGAMPSPEFPSEIKNVGNYNEETKKYENEVKVTGKNLFDKNNFNELKANLNNGVLGSNSAERMLWFKCEKNTTYSFTKLRNNPYSRFVVAETIEMPTIGVARQNTKSLTGTDDTQILTMTYTTSDTAEYIVFLYYNTSSTNYTKEEILDSIQIEKNEFATTYEPYKENITTLILDEPLRDLPNGVKDIAIIKDGKLIVERHIAEDTINCNRISTYNGYTWAQFYKKNDFIGYETFTSHDMLCECARPRSAGYGVGMISSTLNKYDNAILFEEGTTLEEIQPLINGKKYHYQLKEPIIEIYEEPTVIELFEEVNNISNSEDANMIIDYIDNKLIVNNLGNYIAKPIFEIEGTGTIKFILNGYSVFTYNFDEDGKVVIDSEKEDAHLNEIFKNRNMIGEFPKLEIGENIITWEGLVKSIKVVKKSRWL